MKNVIRLLYVCLLLVLAGCASTKLQLTLDLYKEDPFALAPLSESQISRIFQGLQSVEIESKKLADSRVELAENLFDTYKSLWFVAAKSISPEYTRENLESDVENLKNYLDVYKKKVMSKVEEIWTLSKTARDRLDAYTVDSRKKETTSSSKPGEGQKEPVRVTKYEVLDNIRKVSRVYIELGGPLHTDFEESLVKNWPVVSKMATEENLKKMFKNGAPHPEFAELRTTIKKLGETIEELQLRGYRIPMEVSKELEVVATTADENTPGAMKKSADAIAKASTAVPVEIGLGDRGATALNKLVQSTTLLYSQIDRLQDPADPVWRIVSAPENESKWNTTFSKTYFYAEGNSSVVVVRDTPISFRPQRGSNNPAALVKSQLQISRAIGNAAISIAAATTGVPISLDSNEGQSTSLVDSSEKSPKAEELAKQKAKIEQKAKFRAQAVRNLRNNLISMREALRPIDPEKKLKDYPNLQSRLETILKAHKPIFSDLSNSDDSQL